MRKDDPVEFVKELIGSGSIGQSPAFVGHFERNVAFNPAIASMAIETFRNHYQDELQRFQIVHSLHCVGELEELKTQYSMPDHASRRLTRHIREGLIRHLKYEDIDRRIGSDRYFEKLDQLPDELSALEVKKKSIIKTINDLSCAVMTIDGIRGHCFFCNIQAETVVYPHEDTGYGVLARPSAPGHINGVRFLESVRRDQFDTYFRHLPQQVQSE